MTASLTPTTELEAVNLIIGSIGEAPVNTLEDDAITDVAVARQTLATVSRDVQKRGWHFNSEVNYPLTPDADTGKISPPANCLKIDADYHHGQFDITQRGAFLYDRLARSFVFTDTLYVDMVVMLPFEELPEAARWYIALRATRRFGDATLGSDTLHGFNKADEDAAKADLEDAEGDNNDGTVFDHPSYAKLRAFGRG